MIDEALKAIRTAYPMVERSAGEFASIKNGPMRFTIRLWNARGLGHVSAIEANGPLGLMHMETLVINAKEKDAPLYSSDRITAMGKETLLLELYDTLTAEADLTGLETVKQELSALPDHDLGAHWYDPLKLAPSLAKKGGKRLAEAFGKAERDYLAAYLALTAASPAPADPAAKAEKAAAYVDGLLANGGPSTDAFKKLLGADKTRPLFTKFVFGTAE